MIWTECFLEKGKTKQQTKKPTPKFHRISLNFCLEIPGVGGFWTSGPADVKIPLFLVAIPFGFHHCGQLPAYSLGGRVRVGQVSVGVHKGGGISLRM